MDSEKLLSEWQNRIGLSDWRIVLSDKCTPNEMKLDDVDGCSEWTESIKSAMIQILDEKYGQRNNAMKVKELKVLLERFSDDAEVYITGGDGDYSISNVEKDEHEDCALS